MFIYTDTTYKRLNITSLESHVTFFSSPDSSDIDDDVLDAVECEAAKGPVSKRQALAFDRMPPAKRPFDASVVDSDGEEDDLDVEPTDAQIMEILRTHLKRKKFRKKMRTAPDVSGIILWW